MAFFRALNASCLVEPQPPLGLASECVEGAGNIGEVVDKLLIEVHKAKEGLDLLDLHWGQPFHNSTDFHWIHSHMVFQDDQSKVFNLLLLKLAFLWLEKQPPLPEGGQDLMDNLPVIREGVGVDRDIIHIAYGLAIVDEILEDIIHHHLEGHGGVTQSKEHDGWLKQSSVSSECSLPLIPFLDLHIVESPSEIKYGEELSVVEAG